MERRKNRKWRRNKMEQMMEIQERGRETWDRWRGR